MTEVIRVGALEVRFLITAEQSAGSASVFEIFGPAGARMPAPHSHDAFEETIYDQEGVVTYTVAGEDVAVAAVMLRHGLTPAPPPVA